MEALKQTLANTGDDVLVALSNKGIVKRAYKDLEQEQPVVNFKGAEAEVTLAEAVCTIRLPLEESVCSCPSRSMCRHRIAAIVWLKRECSGEKQPFSGEELAAKREAVPDKKPEEKPLETEEKKKRAEKKINKEKAAKLAAAWKEALILQFSIGLTRLSAETEESMERLAVLSHQADFADLERGAREAGSLYEQYFSGAAVFRTQHLMRKLIALYRKAEAAEKAESTEELLRLAGSFRDSYEPTGELFLMGIGNRAFQSGSGYEGEIYYFLETKTGSFYTWTDARPVFYEGVRKNRAGGNQMAPWNLNCSREQMTELCIHLTDAKAAGGNRLSVSQETKGEIVGKRSLADAAFFGKIIWDYRLLLQQYFAKSSDEREETDCLALVGAARVGEAMFSQVEQRFFLPLYDGEGRQLPISVRYSRDEKYTIQLLERLQQRLWKRQQEKDACKAVFFGRLYMEKERLVLYPIEFFDEIDVPEKKERAEEEVDSGVDEKTVRRFAQYMEEAEQLLADLFQSGLDSVLEETLRGLVQLGREGEQIGLHLAGTKFAGMAEALRAKRHRMDFQPEPVLRDWSELMDYIGICKELTAEDSAGIAMKEEKERRL